MKVTCTRYKVSHIILTPDRHQEQSPGEERGHSNSSPGTQAVHQRLFLRDERPHTLALPRQITLTQASCLTRPVWVPMP